MDTVWRRLMVIVVLENDGYSMERVDGDCGVGRMMDTVWRGLMVIVVKVMWCWRWIQYEEG